MPLVTTKNLSITLTTNIGEVPGVGMKRAAAFRKLGIRSVAHLLQHLPARYEHELPEQTIAAASEAIGASHGAEANIAVRGEIAAARAAFSRRAPFQATLQDGTGTIKLSWFNAPWMRGKLHPGMHVLASGKAKRHGDYIEMVNPKWQEAPTSDSDSARQEGFVPVYPASEELPSAVIQKVIADVLDQVLTQIEDHLHDDY